MPIIALCTVLVLAGAVDPGRVGGVQDREDLFQNTRPGRQGKLEHGGVGRSP